MVKPVFPGLFLDLKGMSFKDISKLSEIVSMATGVKIHSLFDLHGAGIVKDLNNDGVWVDLKLKDTPDTVEERAKVVKDSGASILTVHIDGGTSMLEKALKAGPPNIFGVSILTSIKKEEFEHLYGLSLEEAILRRALLAKKVGLHGMICSAQQVGNLASNPELEGFRFVVPGTRSPGKDHNDQQQVDTPANAVLAGATDLVIGRQVTLAENPFAAFQELIVEINSVLN